MKITVYYDGVCPLCKREVSRWRNAAFDCEMEWVDINGNDARLLQDNIDPGKALVELHTRTSDGVVRTSIASYALMLKHLPNWRALGWFLDLPVIRHGLKWFYDWLTMLRLKREGRWPCKDRCNKKP